jgi:leukotriene-A4 hydrolase
MFGHEHNYTCLHVKLQGVDPDDAFSSVPYEKGFNFLFYLEELVGGEAIFNPFLRAHCQRYRYSTVNAIDWQKFFLEYFQDKVAKEKLAEIDWNKWLEQPGLPPKPKFDQTLAQKAHDLAQNIVNKGQKPQGSDIEGWNAAQIVIFLEDLQELQKKSADSAQFRPILDNLESGFHFSASKNSEIRFRWLTLGIRGHHEAVYGAVEQFLGEQGRMKFVRPLYRDLYNSGEKGKQLAREIFGKFSKQYHSIAQKMLAKDLQLA